MNTDNLNML